MELSTVEAVSGDVAPITYAYVDVFWAILETLPVAIVLQGRTAVVTQDKVLRWGWTTLGYCLSTAWQPWHVSRRKSSETSLQEKSCHAAQSA